MNLQFLGAAHTVTGSCYLLEANDHKVLIDCGMFQGARNLRDLNYNDFRFVPSDIDCVLLTHAHVVHCGLIPKLCKQGFKGDIYATKATCDLVNIMLPDSAHIQESDAQITNRKGQRMGKTPIAPLYTIDDAMASLKQFVPIDYDQEINPVNGIRAIYKDAGHIMGSAIIEVYVTENGEETKIVFTGDLGQPDQPIIKDPTHIKEADYLVIESTYGDRKHQIYDKETPLAEIINDTMDRGGNLIIPSFAVGRTQTMLYYLFKLWKANRIEDYSVVV
ncbi:MAG: MBL fold metallo-hydrolase, partial [Megamonas funiformis]|uniref:MBL fold metallo-hydrolase n=1 Tax=Megamonas funiformis TaxID=437897 RepID=UPI001ED4ABFC